MDRWMYMVIGWNVLTALIYGYDKFRARRGGRRVKETTLLTLAFFLGGWGAIFGMVIFNHKTSKKKFRFLVPLFALVNDVMIVFIARMMTMI